jgi:putative flippase GtrA
VNFLGKLIRFGIVGVLTAILHYGVLYFGVELVNAHAYFMHYNWTFGEPAPHGRTLGRYLVMISCGFLINGGLMYAGEQWWSVHYLLAQALALVAVVLWNFVLSNTWVFRR